MLRKSWIHIFAILKREDWLTEDKNGGTVWGEALWGTYIGNSHGSITYTEDSLTQEQ